MEIEFLSELENKVAALVDAVSGLKTENGRLKGELEGAAGLRGENDDLRRQVGELKAGAEDCRGRMAEAAGRVKGLVEKINSAL
jgi:FtsZ-binding cell division protein ZapB